MIANPLNPIPTGNGLNQPIYSYHVTQAGKNRETCDIPPVATYLITILIKKS